MTNLLKVFIFLIVCPNVVAQTSLMLSLNDYLYNNGYSEITKHAVKYLKDGVKENDTERIYYYAIMYTGIAYKKRPGSTLKYNMYNEKKATKLFKKAALRNHSESMLQYGIRLAFGRGVKQDKRLAKIYFAKASEQNNQDAMYYDAECYLIGFGCTKDSIKAYDCYKRIYQNLVRSKSNNKELSDSIFNKAEDLYKKGYMNEALESIKSIAFPVDYYLMRNYSQYTPLFYAP